MDEALTTLANVYFEAGDHEHLVHTSGDDFKHLLSGVRHGHFSHND
jgi:Ala-tRNA(Pro) deacylase